MAIKIYRSTTAGNAPASLADGQLAINEADEVLFYKNSAGTIVSFPLKAVVAALTSVRSLAAGGTGVAASSAADLLVKIGAQAALTFTPENAANRGQANGYAQLGSDGKLPASIIPAAILGALEFATAWNASTNSPALASGTGTKGTIYVVSTNGTTTLDGTSQWYAGDWAVFDGNVWHRISGAAGEVLSVAGLSGVVTALALTAALNAFVGDSGSGGTKGLVPASAAGDAAAGRFLNAGGTWSVPPGTAPPTAASSSDVRTGTDATRFVTSSALAGAQAFQALTDAATVAWNGQSGFNAKVTLGGNRTLGAITNPVEGQAYALQIVQDATGSRTLSYPSAYDFGGAGAPTLSTAAGTVDMLYLLCTSASTPKFKASFVKGS